MLLGPRVYTRRVSRIEEIEAAYRRHHDASRPDDFVFCEPERSALFRAWLGRDRRILDLGCRTGALLRSYRGGNEVVGVDVDRQALAQAAELGIETVWADLDEPLPFEDDSFDAVVAGELLEHLRFPERLIGESRRVLRPNGLLVGSVPNSYRLKSRVRFLLGRPPEFADDPTHLHIFSGDDVRRLLAGFEDVELHYLAGRLTRLGPSLFANDLAFRARKPRH
ncbi:MAG: methyltransferase type 11 [Candidatus Rokuibacteriota bacterium]|nr:MAG: methyltransferase type 11 [Candidatus Rokubacteria bacterium]